MKKRRRLLSPPHDYVNMYHCAQCLHTKRRQVAARKLKEWKRKMNPIYRARKEARERERDELGDL